MKLIAKMKAAGCNAVELSLGEGASCDLGRFQDFLRMAEDEFRFYAIVRPGSHLRPAMPTTP